MNNDVALQLYGGVLFVALGALFGFIHIVVLASSAAKNWRILGHVLEAVAIIIYGIIFIIVSHFLFNGLVIYYTVFSAICGFICIVSTLNTPIKRKIILFVAVHKAKKSAHNKGNDKGEKCQIEKTNITKINLTN